MATTHYNLSMPYVGPIPGGLTPGKIIRIRGMIPVSANRFAVNLQCGLKIVPRDDIALHLLPKFTENVIARNSLHGVNWGPEETVGHMPLVRGQGFELLLLCDPAHYKIAINGQHYTEFIHRIPYARVNHISIDGDVGISELHFEGGAPPPAPVGFTPYLPNPAPFSGNPVPYSANPSPYQSSTTPYPTNPTVYPTNPTVYPTNPTLYPTNPTPYPTNPSLYPASTAPYPPVGAPYGHAPYPAHAQGHIYPGYDPSRQAGYHPSSANKGMVGKAGAVLSGVMGAGAGKKAYKSNKKASKALKYGVPLAGVAGLGLGAYALSKGIHSGSSSSSSSSSSEEE